MTPYPMALFTIYRRGHQVNTVQFISAALVLVFAEHRADVVDAVWLLHKVIWPKDVTFASICDRYLTYVRSHFVTDVVVVFDGYPEDETSWGTKTHERLRRATKQSAPEYIFDKSTEPLCNQEMFLANEKNKRSFINLLSTYLQNADIIVHQPDRSAGTRTSRKFSSRVVDWALFANNN